MTGAAETAAVAGERKLAGRRALVTGSTSGIGRAIAIALAAAGAEVVVTGRDEGRGRAVVADIASGGATATYVGADLADATETASLADRVLATGPVDILVNNAGVFEFGSLLEPDLGSFDRMLAVNLRAPLVLTASLGAAMSPGGAVINISTTGTRKVSAGGGVYLATKAAQDTLTRHLAAELGPRGVRVNAVAPGPTLTEGITAIGGDDIVAEWGRASPAGRVGTPEDAARVVAWLASPDAEHLHGATIAVDGGWANS